MAVKTGGPGTYRPAKPKKPKMQVITRPKPVSSVTSMGSSGTGASAPAPVVPVQPLDPAQVNAQITAQRNIGSADLYATFQQGQLDQNYGYGAGGAANPYSQAAMLQESYKRNQAGTLNSAAASGNLYSGSYGRAQNENSRNYAIGDDQLRRQYGQQSGQIGFDRLQTYANQGSGVDQASYEAMLRALRGG